MDPKHTCLTEVDPIRVLCKTRGHVKLQGLLSKAEMGSGLGVSRVSGQEVTCNF